MSLRRLQKEQTKLTVVQFADLHEKSLNTRCCALLTLFESTVSFTAQSETFPADSERCLSL